MGLLSYYILPIEIVDRDPPCPSVLRTIIRQIFSFVFSTKPRPATMAGPGHWGIFFFWVLFSFNGWILHPSSASLLHEDASFDIRSLPSSGHNHHLTRRTTTTPSSSFLEPIDTGTTLIAIWFQEGGARREGNYLKLLRMRIYFSKAA